MVRSLISLAITTALSALCAEATTIAVMEIGKGGAIHKVSSSSPTTSTAGVMHFWKSTHDASSNGKTRTYRTTEFPNMAVVSDLFTRADGGVVIGVTGEVDLTSMPTVASMVEEDGALGHFHISGNNGRKLMKQLMSPVISSDKFEAAMESKAKAAVVKEGNKLEAVSVHVENTEAAASVDASISRVLKSIAKEAEKSGSTILVHLVVDDADVPARRRLLTERQLEDGGDNNENAYQIPGEYVNGVFVTPYRTMFQIQYFNVITWTAVGLFGILFAANMMTMNMPLMPDTLLFGESAKMVAE